MKKMLFRGFQGEMLFMPEAQELDEKLQKQKFKDSEKLLRKNLMKKIKDGRLF